MAVVTTKATAIKNRDSNPKVLNDSILEGAMLQESVGTVETASGDSIGSKYLLASVPSNCRISDVLVSCDDIGATTVADFGVYETTDKGGAVVDADFFASALALDGGALNQSVVQNESGAFDIADIEKPLWKALGKTEDPRCMYDIVATLTAAADAAGTLSVKVRYVI